MDFIDTIDVTGGAGSVSGNVAFDHVVNNDLPQTADDVDSGRPGGGDVITQQLPGGQVLTSGNLTGALAGLSQVILAAGGHGNLSASNAIGSGTGSGFGQATTPGSVGPITLPSLKSMLPFILMALAVVVVLNLVKR